MLWKESMRISAHDVDATGKARPSCVLRYLQDAANWEMHELGPSNEALWAKGQAFLLSRVRLRILLTLEAYQPITAESWSCESRGASFLRCGRLLTESGAVAAELASVWALMDTTAHRLLRVTDYPANFTPEPPLALELPMRPRAPKELAFAPCGTYPVRYAEIDRNHHMNNTCYPDLFCQFLPEAEQPRVRDLVIHYLHEARLGETLTVLAAEADGVRYFRSVKPDGTINAEAEFVIG